MINLYSSVQGIVHSLLNSDRNNLKLFSDEANISSLFCDFVSMGCDFYELLRVFCHNDGLDLLNANMIQEYLPQPNGTCRYLEKDIRSIISHWTNSKYHSGSISEVVQEIFTHIVNDEIGIYTYHSNKNPNNTKAANDIYVLFVMQDKAVFADLNRKRSYLFLGGNYDQNSCMRRQPI